ncbi:MAG: amino acid adenylation domain-containing protein [Verrucomicrobiota bacterium]
MPFPAVIRQAAAEVEIPLHGLLDRKAATSPGEPAFRFLTDGDEAEQLLTCGELAAQARSLASELVRHGAAGQPVLLIHPPGLDFITGLFACWYAGAIAVPAYPPRGSRHKKRLDAILSDSGAKLALADSDRKEIHGVTFLHPTDGGDEDFPAVDPASPCLLQYTSGSTAEPKGVMISHSNFRAHFASLLAREDLHFRSLMSWLPPYHDMGLVLKILYAFELGSVLTFFTPEHFIRNPVRWLRSISRYRSEMSGAPNFAYELCLRSIRDEELEGVDLSCWKAAACGAERIRPETLERFAARFAPWGFRKEAFSPGYGLAEATLIVTAAPTGEAPRISTRHRSEGLVSNGTPLPGVALRIADPVSGENRDEGEIGEIRVKGPTVSSGYWRRPDLSTAGFSPDGELLTGDLGYLEGGELYVTGRIKDLIIIDGTNHAPEDLESAVLSAISEITAAAAFASDNHVRESAVLLAEVERASAGDHARLCAAVRRVIGESLEIPIKRVILVRAGLIPRTTSGKIRRSACREAIEGGLLPILFDDESASAATHGCSPGDSLALLLELVGKISGHHDAGAGDDLVELGLSSMDMTRLAALIQDRTGVAISIGDLFSARSIAEIAAMIPRQAAAHAGLPAIIPESGLHGDVMTHSQERMWFLHQLEPDSAAYHVFGALELNGPLDPRAIDHAVRSVVSRHDILRSRHGSEMGNAKVWIERNEPLTVGRHHAEDETALQACLTDFASRPFSLAGESPIRASLVSCGGNRHVLAICVHHIVADGWSMRLLAREIADTYALSLTGRTFPEPARLDHYLDYAVSHRRWVDSGAVDAQIEYWKNKLAGHSGVLQLATDFPRPPKPSSAGGAVERPLPTDLITRVSVLAKLHRGTPFMVHLAAFLLLLRRHGAGDDPVVAVPVANRNHAAAADLIGTLVNTLPFRLTLDAGETFSDLLNRVREATFEMQAAQDAPFEKIIDAVKPDRTRDHSPLAQVMFDHQEIPIAETWEGGVECKPYIAHRGAVQFDLSLLLTVLGGRQQISIEYRKDLFLHETAVALLDRYLEIMECACNFPDLEISGISGLTKSDHRQLAQTSQGPVRPDFPRQTTPDLIAGRVAMHPFRTAVAAGDDTLDYATLSSRSDQLAAALRNRGVRPGERIGILLERDVNLTVALLATWKAGAAYLPLDHANPPERLKAILEDQAPVHLLVSPNLTTCLPPGMPMILMDQNLMASSPDGKVHRHSPADTAYVIYTSGSTGKPKGVVISHGALANFLLSMAESPGFAGTDRLLAVTTISFDISALEIFLPLITGGMTDLVSTAVARDGTALLERLQSTRATVMQATPATWRLLIDAGWQGSPDLRILCGGEALDLPLASQLVKMGSQLWNLYGPTETTIWSSLWRVPADPDAIRIGSPIANTGLHVLAPDGSALPPGVTGELWISGDGLAKGYWNRPKLTSVSFVSPPPAPRRYNTGDLARWHADGSLECLGRSDGQVKIRGFRVELGEIESAIAAHPQVAQAKVAFRGSDPASRKVVAWITPIPGNPPPDPAGLRDFIETQLPAYMLPADIGVIDSFPLNANGKVDVSKLENPQSLSLDTKPLTHTESKLAAIWSELLDRPIVNQEDDWFHIGGHSLLALRLFSRIHLTFECALPLSTILEHSTLRALAEVIDGNSTSRDGQAS